FIVMSLVVEYEPGLGFDRINVLLGIFSVRPCVIALLAGMVTPRGKIAEAIENRGAFVDFNSLWPMGMVTEDNAGPGIDRRVCNYGLIIARTPGVVHAPVQRNKNKVGILLG